MKTLFIALGMALILFVYGYVASSLGHDHSRHEQVSTNSGGHHESANKDEKKAHSH